MAVCTISNETKEAIKLFRFRKSKDNAALIMKAEKSSYQIVVDELVEDCSLEELQDHLPETQPRYVLYSYEYRHDSDGRISYPLCFIFVSPDGSKPEQLVMYTSSMNNVVTECGLTKVFDVRSTEELTEDWLREKLAFFK